MYSQLKDFKHTIKEGEYIALDKLYKHIFTSINNLISNELENCKDLSFSMRLATIECSIRNTHENFLVYMF